MKKWLIILLLLGLLGGSTYLILNSKSIDGNKLVYTCSPLMGSNEELEKEYVITITKDRHLIVDDQFRGENMDIQLSNEDYKKIMDYACSKKFTLLKEDISNTSVLDGSSEEIQIYKDDKIVFNTGGMNPTNIIFTKLVDMLDEIILNNK